MLRIKSYVLRSFSTDKIEKKYQRTKYIKNFMQVHPIDNYIILSSLQIHYDLDCGAL